jgi:outer membrane receptor protein involved in Fe transport
VTSIDNRTTSFVLLNAATATTKGVEASAEYLATENLTLHGNLGYNIARYKSFPGASCYESQTVATGCVGGVQNLSGHPLLRAPDLSFDLGADYKYEFVPGWTTSLAADAAYTSSYESAGDSNPGGIQPAFWKVNASIHMTTKDGHYDFALIGKDLTNSYYLLTSNGTPGGPVYELNGFFNRPREVLIQASYRY